MPTFDVVQHLQHKLPLGQLVRLIFQLHTEVKEIHLLVIHIPMDRFHVVCSLKHSKQNNLEPSLQTLPLLQESTLQWFALSHQRLEHLQNDSFQFQLDQYLRE